MNYANGTGTATLYWGDCRQVIDGFGGDSAPQFPYSGNDISMLWTLNSGGIGLSFSQFDAYWDENQNGFNGTVSECSAMAGIAATGGLIYSTQSYTPPNLVTGTALTNIQGFSDWLTQWAQAVQSQCGVNLYAASVQNEPNIPFFTWPNGPTSVHDFILNNLGPEFASNGLTTKIAIPEEDGWDFSWADPTLQDPAAAAYVGILFVHYAGTAYGDPVSPYPYQNLGLHLWHTESNANGDSTSWLGGVLFNLQSIHEYIVDGNANGYNFEVAEVINSAYWGTTGLLNDHVPSKMFYGLGQWSAYVRPGWHLYGATEHPIDAASCNSTACTGSSISFYRSPSTNQFAIIAVNSDGDTPVNFSFNGFTANSVTPVVSSASLNMAQQSAISAGSGFSYTMPAQSITTFLGTAN